MLIHSAEITGSVQFNDIDVSNITNVSGFATTASVDSLVVKTGSYASTSSVNELQSKTGSYATTSSVNEIQSKTGSYTSTSSFGDYTSSNDSKVNAIIAKTGSLATTGSNTFIGTNVFTGSVFITSDLIVQGSSSLQNITASSVSIGTNTVVMNTNTPILRFGGLSVQDSGSTAGRSGSLFWDSVNDHWINVNPSGSDEGYNSAMVIGGPKNTGSLGAEVGLTTNYIPLSQGEDHIADSIIFQSGSTNIGIGTNNAVSTLTVNRPSSGNVATFVAGTSNLVNEYSGITLSANVQGADIWYASEIRSINTNSTPDTLNPRLGFFTQNTGTYLPANRIERMSILSNGNVGIGTTTPSVNANQTSLTINGTNNSRLDMQVSGTRNAGFVVASDAAYLETTAAIPLVFYTNSAERMRITSAGDVQVGGNSVLVDRALTEVAVSTYSLPSNAPVQNNGSQNGADCRNYDYSSLIWGTSGASQAQNENAGVSMDFGSAQSIKRIVLYAYDVRNVNSYKVSYSSDNTNWTILRVFPHIVKSGLGPMIFDFNASGLLSYRYWRVQINSWTNRDATNWYLSECIAYS